MAANELARVDNLIEEFRSGLADFILILFYFVKHATESREALDRSQNATAVADAAHYSPQVEEY